jgi:transcriptional regulator with XRE-family HTH domain
MTGSEVRQARKTRGWTQSELGRRLRVSQGYVSLIESNRRRLPRHLSITLVRLLGLPPSNLPVGAQAPLPQDQTVRGLAALGYPGFAHLTRKRTLNPAELLLRTLRSETVEARVVEALPWVLVKFPDLDWPWLVRHVKLHDLQNRLGFVVTLARQLAERRDDSTTATTLRTWEQTLEPSRLQKEDEFAGSALTDAERRWLRANRSAEAAHWNVLSNLSADSFGRA